MRDALLRQWRLVAKSLDRVDLESPSRVKGWRNREVVAHLAVQPRLLARFLAEASIAPPAVSLVTNLAGTSTLAEMIDGAARAAGDADLDLAGGIDAVAPALAVADLRSTVTTLQGPIGLEDYVRTRCVEAVVHGRDLVPPVEPDAEAEEVAAAALIAVLASRRPDLAPVAEALPRAGWIDQATGRASPVDALAPVLPVMS